MLAVHSAARASDSCHPTIGGFALEQCLERRPEWATFVARQIALQRKVLLKIWTCDDAWSSELLSDAALNHPGCLSVYDVGELPNGRIFLAAELIHGCHMGQLLSSPLRPSWPDALRVALTMCGALTHAHGREVFHGALTPSRVWFADGQLGAARLCDFGQRRVLLSDPDDKTPLAPETLRDGHVDARSDVYGLGALLYQMLSGEEPFPRAERFDVLRSQMEGAAPIERYDVPEALRALIARCLAPDPDARPQSILELASALRELDLDAE